MFEDPDPDGCLENGDRIHSLAQRVIPDANLCEDIAQEVWLQSLTSPRCSEPRSRGWLRIVLRNLFRRSLRTEQRRAARERVVARREGEGTPASLSLEREEVRRRVSAAVRRLREPYRSTVILRYFEGVGTEDIAAKDGVSVATVRARLSRARATLRERLGGVDGAFLAAPSCALLKPGAADGILALKLLGESGALPVGGAAIMSGKVLATVTACILIGGFIGWSVRRPSEDALQATNSLEAERRAMALESELERTRDELNKRTAQSARSDLELDRLRSSLEELTRAAAPSKPDSQDDTASKEDPSVRGDLDWALVARAFTDVAAIVQKSYKERTPIEAAKITELYGAMATLSARARALHARPFLEPGFLTDLASSIYSGSLGLDEQQQADLAELTTALEAGLPADGRELTPLDRLALRDGVIDDLHRGLEDLLTDEQFQAWPRVVEFSERFLRFGDSLHFGADRPADHFLQSWLSNALDVKGEASSALEPEFLPAAERYHSAARDVLNRYGASEKDAFERLLPEERSELDPLCQRE